MSAHSDVLVANLSFYQAFADGDFDAMRDLWATTVPTSCTHPGWATLIGRDAVLESWRAILAQPGGTAVRCVEPTVLRYGLDVAAVLCREIVDDVPLAATNVFVREAGAWRLAHHHAGQIAEEFPGAELDDEVFH